MKTWIATLGLAMAVVSYAAPLTPRGTSGAPLIVHEWGTFTSFQAADGGTIAGINVDDEPVPAFVHRLSQLEILTTRVRSPLSKGIALCHKDVTLRLETPVLYFYPSSGLPHDQGIDVAAGFPGGWLTEYFPQAVSGAPGFPRQLTTATRGHLQWRNLRLGATTGKLPATAEPVWLAPRNVRSAVVSTAEGEAEKFLFYRGVAHLDAPLVVQQSRDTVTIAVRDGEAQLDRFPSSWLVRVLRDGRVWYRAVDASDVRGDRISLSLDDWQAAQGGLVGLRRELEEALVSDGLFADEARAMLDTWQQSYFGSEGLRLFFLLPQQWTDAHLPLAVSVPTDITRVMVGRIELVSSDQRKALEAMYALPESALNVTSPAIEFLKSLDGASATEREAGWLKFVQLDEQSRTLTDVYAAFGQDVPLVAQLYDSLGRFREPLLRHELASATDSITRDRLQRIMEAFSVCALGPGG